MSFLLKDQWQQWARDWGVTHLPEKGWMYRTEGVLGARRGLLFRASWGNDRAPGLQVMVRFPKAPDLERLRAALIADAALDALPGKGAARRKMALFDGRKGFMRAQGGMFLLGSDFLFWRHAFAFRTPKPAEVEGWVDALVGAVARATPVFDGRCETCGTGQATQYVVVDELPRFLCSACQQSLKAEGEMAERAYEMTEARHLNGLALACVAMVLGGVAWAAIGALTHRIFAAAAMGIGVLVAWGYRRGAGRVDGIGRGIGATVTVASVMLGEILLYSFWISRGRPAVGFRLDAGLVAYLLTWAKNPAEEAIPMVFGLLGAWVATRALQKPKLAAKVETAAEAGERKVA